MIQAESLSSQAYNMASIHSLLRNCAAKFFCACMGVTSRLRKERGLSAGFLTWNKMQISTSPPASKIPVTAVGGVRGGAPVIRFDIPEDQLSRRPWVRQPGSSVRHSRVDGNPEPFNVFRPPLQVPKTMVLRRVGHRADHLASPIRLLS